MDPLIRRAADVLTVAIEALGLLLMLILAGSAALPYLDTLPGVVDGFARVFGGWGVWLAWPLLALLCVSVASVIGAAAIWPRLRSGRRTVAVVLGASACVAAVVEGVRPPVSRTGVFTGGFVYGTVMHPDIFIPCSDTAPSLPRGGGLGFEQIQELPLMALIRVPERGWHGSHPRDWPHTVSDSHGGLYYTIRVRGTLTGPGNYGSPPAIQYRMRIDSVLSTTPRRPGSMSDCQKGDFRNSEESGM